MKVIKKRPLLPNLIIVVLVIVVAVLGYLYFRKPSVIPGNITKQTTFPIFYPKTSQQISIVKNSFRYSGSNGQLTFKVIMNDVTLNFNEQSSPNSFSNDPNLYTTLIANLNGYASFSSVNGNVDLTKPAQTKQETAVMNAKGTLLFVNSSLSLSETNWQLLFNSLDYTQP